MDGVKDKILILDFGSQYTQLIARKVRESHVYAEIFPCHVPIDVIKKFQPRGIILSGSPSSVYQKKAPLCSREVFSLHTPVLGICYGMQLMAHLLGGGVSKAVRREYGRAELFIDDASDLFEGVGDRSGGKTVVWMSHGDRIESLPPGFTRLAHTENSPLAAMKNGERRFYSLQFHPEVVHTPEGKKILQNFLYRMCGCSPAWDMGSFHREAVRTIREKIGEGRALCALSGGVDSSVAAALVHEAIGKRLTCIFVDNGLLRAGEAGNVVRAFTKNLKMNMKCVNATYQFIRKLRGIIDPEKKRRIIGGEFIRLFEKEARALGKVSYLVQGTLYPDVIESHSFKGPSATIKTHHNVGGLPRRMRLTLIEPLKELFKDEVRQLGKEMGLSDEILWRQPFPGPGLAVRCVGDVTVEKLSLLRAADAIVEEEIGKAGLSRDLWQFFAVLLPVRTVGVMGDERTYDYAVAVRAVISEDGMTADWAQLPHTVLGALSTRIVNEVKGINRVVYDISSKPPSTIEWE